MITEEGTYKSSMVSTPIRIGPIMLKMFIIQFKYMFSTLIISKSRMNLFLTKQKMPTLRPVTACSVRAVDESVFISLAERQNKSE